ncbi:MAG TPA: glycosyltransferase family 2 protein [Armatimonadota bacterium]|jgi:glycosyltransferase involved in cell wall biosynthesis
MSGKPPISAFIITYNNAHEISRCLESLQFVDEIVVVDSLSTDGTQALAAALGARVIEQPFLGYAPQLRFAEGCCTHDWALNLYADETVSPELREGILAVFSSESGVSGYRMPRRNYLHGRWIPHAGYYPSWHLRLFRRSCGGHIDRKIHQKIKVRGSVGTLRGAIDHWAWMGEGEILDNFVQYARLEAEEMCEKGQVVRLHHFGLPFLNFLKRFIVKKGFLDGSFGAVVSARPAAAQMIRLILAWEMQHRDWLDAPGLPGEQRASPQRHRDTEEGLKR